MLFPVKLPAGLPVPKCPGTNDGSLCPFVKYETKMSKQEIRLCRVMRSNLYSVKAGVSRSHSSQMSGVMFWTR